ncbi:MAG TPA: lipoyl(octanoyl) transferase LipB [Caulobacteraceae bacterium]|jgi:lipoyl(octanoyl) transferase|nr:lipoyl(octanoyl) transferase LipB [Caulobacteraceae bacterium]
MSLAVALPDRPLTRADGAAAQWAISPGLTPYPQAEAFMERRAAQIAAGEAAELVWLVEHPPLYTAGVSAKDHDLLDPHRFPVFRAGRGGQFTYHGPGQRVVYLMLDLRERGRDVSAFVGAIEAWIVLALARLGLVGVVRAGRVGVWLEPATTPGVAREAKVAAIGVKLRRWISFHGLSLNVAPDLSHFEGIVPCGLPQFDVTSLAEIGLTNRMSDADDALESAFTDIFGRLDRTAAPADFAP